VPDKIATSFRLTESAVSLLAKIAKEHGIAQSAVIEILIRQRAERLGITVEEKV
jgi:hypothetical protein